MEKEKKLSRKQMKEAKRYALKRKGIIGVVIGFAVSAAVGMGIVKYSNDKEKEAFNEFYNNDNSITDTDLEKTDEEEFAFSEVENENKEVDDNLDKQQLVIPQLIEEIEEVENELENNEQLDETDKENSKSNDKATSKEQNKNNSNKNTNKNVFNTITESAANNSQNLGSNDNYTQSSSVTTPSVSSSNPSVTHTTPSTSASSKPTANVTSTPSSKPTANVTSTPSSKPTASATSTPSSKPTASATSTPSSKPTASATPTPHVHNLKIASTTYEALSNGKHNVVLTYKCSCGATNVTRNPENCSGSATTSYDYASDNQHTKTITTTCSKCHGKTYQSTTESCNLSGSRDVNAEGATVTCPTCHHSATVHTHDWAFSNYENGGDCSIAVYNCTAGDYTKREPVGHDWQNTSNINELEGLIQQYCTHCGRENWAPYTVSVEPAASIEPLMFVQESDEILEEDIKVLIKK